MHKEGALVCACFLPTASPWPFFPGEFQELRINGGSCLIKFRTRLQKLMSGSVPKPTPSGVASPVASLMALAWDVKPTHKDPSTRFTP